MKYFKPPCLLAGQVDVLLGGRLLRLFMAILWIFFWTIVWTIYLSLLFWDASNLNTFDISVFCSKAKINHLYFFTSHISVSTRHSHKERKSLGLKLVSQELNQEYLFPQFRVQSKQICAMHLYLKTVCYKSDQKCQNIIFFFVRNSIGLIKIYTFIFYLVQLNLI